MANTIIAKMFNHLTRTAAVIIATNEAKTTTSAYLYNGEKNTGRTKRMLITAKMTRILSKNEYLRGEDLFANTSAKANADRVESNKIAGRAKSKNPLTVSKCSTIVH
jgi:hypothetical protein